MFKTVTIEPRGGDVPEDVFVLQTFPIKWIVKFRLNDTIDHERVFASLDDAFVYAQAWLLHSGISDRD